MPASGWNAPRRVEIPALAPDSRRGRVPLWCGASRSASSVLPVIDSHGSNSWWCLAAEPKSHTIGSVSRVSNANRISLSIAQVPMWVAVM